MAVSVSEDCCLVCYVTLHSGKVTSGLHGVITRSQQVKLVRVFFIFSNNTSKFSEMYSKKLKKRGSLELTIIISNKCT